MNDGASCTDALGFGSIVTSGKATVYGFRVVGDLADQAAASMNMSTEELLAASPMTELLKDVLSYSPDPQQQDIDVPTFTSRY